MESMTRATALLLLAVAWGCGDSPSPTSREALESGTFLTRTTPTGSITLSEGTATSVGDTTREFSLASVAEGDLDLDGETDAVAILAEDDGISHYLYLHAFLSDGRVAEDVSARLVGDRVEVRRLSIDDAIIRVDLMLREPGQPITTPPTVPHSAYFALTDRGLIPAPQTEIEPAAEPRGMGAERTLYGHEWVLERFEMGDWTGKIDDADGPPSLRFVTELADMAGASGQVTGFAGCNRIFGSFRAEEGGTLRVSGIASTRRACRGPATDFERRFIAAFKSADGYRVEGDTLIIDVGGGTMTFGLGGRVRAAEPTAFEDGIEPSVPAVDAAARRSA